MIQITTPSNYAYDRAIADHAALERQKREHVERLMHPKSVGDLLDMERLDCAMEQVIVAVLLFGCACIIAGLIATSWPAQVIAIVFVLCSSALVTWAYLTGKPTAKTKEINHV